MKATISATSPLRTAPANTYEKGESSSQKKEEKKYSAHSLPSSSANQSPLTRSLAKREPADLVKYHETYKKRVEKYLKKITFPTDINKVKTPERIKIKTKHINLKRLKVIGEDFNEYAKDAINFAKTGKSKKDLNKYDEEMLPLFVESENKRNKDLKLQCFDNIFDLKKEITKYTDNKKEITKYTDNKITKNIICPLPNQSRDPKLRHSENNKEFYSLQMKIHQNKIQHITVIGAKESAKDHISTLLHTFKFITSKKNVTYFSTNEKNTKTPLHALSKSLKIQKEKTFFDKIADDKEKGKETKDKQLPIRFFKHIDSMEELSSLSNRRKETVTKFGPEFPSAHEDLESRVLAYNVKRDGKIQNTSIDGFRLQEINRVTNYLVKNNNYIGSTKIESLKNKEKGIIIKK